MAKVGDDQNETMASKMSEQERRKRNGKQKLVRNLVGFLSRKQ